MKKIISSVLMISMLVSLAFMKADVRAATQADYAKPAEFTVTDTVTNTDPGAWSFTAADSIVGSSSPITNEMISGGGFEPIVFRTKISVTAFNGNVITSDLSSLDWYDSYKEGFINGGEARVYRPDNGKLQLVRTSKIKNFYNSQAFRALNSKAVSGTQAYVGFDDWNMDGAYYYSVVAVDSQGRESAKSDWVQLMKDSTFSDKGGVENANASTSITSSGKEGTLNKPSNLSVVKSEINGKSCGKLTWDAVTNAAGYVVYYSYYAPEDQKGLSLELENDSVALKNNDFVFIEKKFSNWSRKQNFSPRIFNSSEGQDAKTFAPQYSGKTLFPDENNNITWEMVPHGNKPDNFTSAGETCMMVDFKGKKDTVSFMQYNHAGPNGNNSQANDYYKILEPGHTYVVEFWARSDDSTASVKLSFDQFYQNRFPAKTIAPTSEWKKYSFEYICPNEVNTSPWIGRTMLDVSATNKVYIDAYQMYDKQTEPNIWSKKDMQAAADSGFAFYRCHTFIKSGAFTYNMDMLCNPSGAFNSSAAGCVTLDSFLKDCKGSGMSPWFQIEMPMSPEEWKGWVEFMSADYDANVDTPETKPWAYKRVCAGQTKPWIDEFDKIIFEISNETWNGMFQPWNFAATKDETTGANYNAAQTYGLYHEFVLDTMKESPYWSKMAGKFKSVLGGWAPNNYELDAGKQAPSADYLTRAAYNGGWDEGTILSNDKDGYLLTAAYGIQQADVDAKSFSDRAKTYNDTRALGTYEAGPGYPLPGWLTEEQTIEHQKQNNVQKSQAGAVSTLDCFLLNAANYNYGIQNYFTFSRGQMYWTSHASMKDGGQEHLAFRALTMYNNYGLGDFTEVNANSVPTYDLPKSGNRKALDNAPMVSVYTTKTANKYNVFVLNRKIANYPYTDNDGYTPVTLNLPFESVSKIKVHRMIGQYDETNILADNVKMEELEIPASGFNKRFVLNDATGAEVKGVSPCGIYMYEFYLDNGDLPQQAVVTAFGYNSGVTLEWNPVSDAGHYFIFRSEEENGIYTKIGACDTETRFDDKDVVTGKQYYYKVRTFAGDVYSDSIAVSGSMDGNATQKPVETPVITATPTNTPTPATSTPSSVETPTPTGTEITPTPSPVQTTAAPTSTATQNKLVEKTVYIPVKDLSIAKVSGTVKAAKTIYAYKKNTLKGNKAGKIAKNKNIKVISVKGNYATVKIKGKKAYVNSSYLKYSKTQTGKTLRATKGYKKNDTKHGYYTKISKNVSKKVKLISKKYYMIKMKVKV